MGPLSPATWLCAADGTLWSGTMSAGIDMRGSWWCVRRMNVCDGVHLVYCCYVGRVCLRSCAHLWQVCGMCVLLTWQQDARHSSDGSPSLVGFGWAGGCLMQRLGPDAEIAWCLMHVSSHCLCLESSGGLFQTIGTTLRLARACSLPLIPHLQ